VNGKTAYREARSGEALELESRAIEITLARLIGVEIEPHVAWEVELTVSKGTYVRAIARDLGEAMGSAAHLGGLRRTGSGNLSLADAVTLDRLVEAGKDASAYFYDPVLALGMPALDLGEAAAAAVRNGRPLRRETLDEASSTTLAAFASDLVALRFEGRLLALYEALGDNLVPQVVFAQGIETGAR
jgi:tRNA pseudouridine55 synthase